MRIYAWAGCRPTLSFCAARSVRSPPGWPCVAWPPCSGGVACPYGLGVTQEGLRETVVRMVRPSIESRVIGGGFDGFEFERLLHDESVSRDDFALMARLMLTEVVRLSQMAGVISVSVAPVIGLDGQLMSSGGEWLR